ncbi:hypothetical protein GCM10023146_39510 [Nocardioides caricicola]
MFHLGRVRLAALTLTPIVALSSALAVAPTSSALSTAEKDVAPVDAARAAFGGDALPEAGVYNVILKAPPSASYAGGRKGYARTAPAAGGSFNPRAAAVQQYERMLASQQDRVLQRVGDPNTIYRYTTALNGFSAQLTGPQVLALRKDASVLTVNPQERVQATTVHTPEFLHMSGKNGQWAKNGGTAKAGKGVVVGVIDTGIWPENPSFKGKKGPVSVPGFYGTCEAGEEFPATTCNSKVVGARYYDAYTEGKELAETEYRSPRDGGGHGSHTAATAAGNYGVKVKIEGQDFGRASGMAPAAMISVYKVLWSFEDASQDGGSDVDIIAAIDDAVSDGVDVINYSIGSTGGGDAFTDASNLAFMNASIAGVFVATSAGNDGPDATTVGNNGPWMTTTAASTSYNYQGGVVLGNGEKYVGAMVSDKAVPTSPFVYAADVEVAESEDDGLCGPDSLDPAKVEGTIVACDRGVYDRIAKSAEVARAGGVGMVLLNTSDNSIDADFHSVPTVHLNVPDADEVYAYVTEDENPTARINPNLADDTPVPQIAGFSSRGPAATDAGGGDVIKPDIAAPGVSVVAAVAPPSNHGHKWDLYSGTSMASPHIAGLAAFIHRLKPYWTPAMVKSAMMTTSYDLKDEEPSPFAQGAGQVDPRKFLDPGLVFDARGADYLNFLSGQGVTTATGAPLTPNPIDASDLNLPSIGIGDLVGNQTVTRRVTNVSGKGETYTISSTGLDGVTVTATPASITVPAGATRSFEVTLASADDVAYGEFTSGKLLLTGSRGHKVQLPVSVKPEALVADDEVVGTVPNGTATVEGLAGFSGSIDLKPSGLVGSTPVVQDLPAGGFNPDAPSADADTFKSTVVVPAGSSVRFRTDGDPDDDLDVWVYLDGQLVGASATASSDEVVTGIGVPAGTYDVYVNAFAAGEGPATMRYDQWVVADGADAGNMVLDPDPLPVESGEPFSYTATWTGLAESQNWFGYVTYGDRDMHTIVQVD